MKYLAEASYYMNVIKWFKVIVTSVCSTVVIYEKFALCVPLKPSKLANDLLVDSLSC